MAIFGNPDEFKRLLESAARFDSEQKARAREATSQAGRSALEASTFLAEILTTLPTAVIAARQAEYARLEKQSGGTHPRLTRLAASLAPLEQLATGMRDGRARAERALAIQRAPGGAALHGFVSTADGTPVEGLTVRLVGEGFEKNHGDVAQDGYFRVPLPGEGERVPGQQPLRPLRRQADKATADTQQAERVTATVVVTDKRGATLHEDPVPLTLGPSLIYREYRLTSKKETRKSR